jgi:hypothetical protein
MKAVTLLLEAMREIFGYFKLRLFLKNSPDMQHAKKVQQNIDEDNRIAKAIENRDTKTIQNELGD